MVESKSEQLHWALECEKALRGDIYEQQSPAPATTVHEHITATINAIEEGDATKARQHLRAYLAACSNDWKQLNNP